MFIHINLHGDPSDSQYLQAYICVCAQLYFLLHSVPSNPLLSPVVC